MNRRWSIAIFLVLLLLSAIFSACGGGTVNPLQPAYDDAQNEIAALQEEIERLRSEKSTQQESYTNLHAENMSVAMELIMLEDIMMSLQNEKLILQAEVEQMQNELSLANVNYDLVRAELQRMAENLDLVLATQALMAQTGGLSGTFRCYGCIAVRRYSPYHPYPYGIIIFDGKTFRHYSFASRRILYDPTRTIRSTSYARAAGIFSLNYTDNANDLQWLLTHQHSYGTNYAAQIVTSGTFSVSDGRIEFVLLDGTIIIRRISQTANTVTIYNAMNRPEFHFIRV